MSKGSLTFHDSLSKQHHKRGRNWVNPNKFPVISPYSDQFLTFTIQKPITDKSISGILLIDWVNKDVNTDSGYVEVDLTSDSGFTDLKSIEEYDSSYEELRYDGDTLDATLTDGIYYLRITLETEVFYSNVFRIET